MLNRTLSIISILILTPFAVATAKPIEVENDFGTFTLPSGWGNVSSQARNVRKPIIYLRQKYKVTSIGSTSATAYIYVQDIPSFRGLELPLSEIDAAFTRVSQISGDTQTLSDYYIPSLTELQTATGTLLGHPSREISYWTEPTETKYFYRLSYTSFGGKLYGLEMVTLKNNAEHDAEWKLLVNTFRSTLASPSSSSARSTRQSSSSSSKAKVDKTPRGERTKLRVRKRIQRLTAAL